MKVLVMEDGVKKDVELSEDEVGLLGLNDAGIDPMGLKDLNRRADTLLGELGRIKKYQEGGDRNVTDKSISGLLDALIDVGVVNKLKSYVALCKKSAWFSLNGDNDGKLLRRLVTKYVEELGRGDDPEEVDSLMNRISEEKLNPIMQAHQDRLKELAEEKEEKVGKLMGEILQKKNARFEGVPEYKLTREEIQLKSDNATAALLEASDIIEREYQGYGEDIDEADIKKMKMFISGEIDDGEKPKRRGDLPVVGEEMAEKALRLCEKYKDLDYEAAMLLLDEPISQMDPLDRARVMSVD